MNKNTISKATAPNAEPTSGWMLQVISQMTKKDHSTCTQVIDYLLLRLSVNNPYVKAKTLKVIKHCCENGDMTFPQLIAKKSEDIRQYANYRGSKDPLHGDALNQKVRNAAQAAINAMFNVVENNNYNGGGMDYQVGSGGGIGSSSSKPATGGWKSYWNKEPEKPVQHTGFGSGVGSNALTGSSSGYSDHEVVSSNFGGQQGSMGGGRMEGVGSSMQGYGSTSSLNAQQNSKTWKEWGMEKLNFLSQNGNKKMYNDHISENFPSFLNMEQKPYQPPSANTFFNEEEHTSEQSTQNQYNASAQWQDDKNTSEPLNSDASGSYEQRIVDEICKPSVKSKPSRGELHKFVQKAKGVRADLIAELLDAKLKSPIWKAKLRALYVIEAFIADGNQEVTEYFATNVERIDAASQAVQASVAKRASEILNILNPSEQPRSNRQQAASNATESKAPLFDFNGGAEDEVENLDDMFGGMNVKSKSPSHSSSSAQHTTEHTQQNPKKRSDEELLMDMFSNPQSRKRSDSKNNILQTLDHFMTPTTPNMPPPPTNTLMTNQGMVPSPQQMPQPYYTHQIPQGGSPYGYQPHHPSQYPNYSMNVHSNTPPSSAQSQAQGPRPKYAFLEKQEPEKKRNAFDFVSEKMKNEINAPAGTRHTPSSSDSSSNNIDNGSAFDFL